MLSECTYPHHSQAFLLQSPFRCHGEPFARGHALRFWTREFDFSPPGLRHDSAIFLHTVLNLRLGHNLGLYLPRLRHNQCSERIQWR